MRANRIRSNVQSAVALALLSVLALAPSTAANGSSGRIAYSRLLAGGGAGILTCRRTARKSSGPMGRCFCFRSPFLSRLDSGGLRNGVAYGHHLRHAQLTRCTTSRIFGPTAAFET
jgi:hypothetical protein